MTNEMAALREFRSEVPEPSEVRLRVVEARMVAHLHGAPAPRRAVRRIAWRVGLAAGLAGAVTVGVVTIRHQPSAPAAPPPLAQPSGAATSGTGPRIQPVSAAQVLDLAAQAAQGGGEITPRADQFIVYESITMYTADVGDGSRYLYRTKRTAWLSADGTRTGSVRIEYLQPQAYPGWPIPPQAKQEVGRVDLLPVCGSPNNYVRLRTLPTDPQRMFAYLQSQASGGGDRNHRLWEAAGDLLRENYLPPAQRAALYRAINLIPGVVLVPQARDAAGRAGVAVGIVDRQAGVRDEIVFAPDTYRYLGERAFVVDAATAKAPVGSQLAGTAELSVTVADSAPVATSGPKGPDCR